jgi:hypothetical protein
MALADPASKKPRLSGKHEAAFNMFNNVIDVLMPYVEEKQNTYLLTADPRRLAVADVRLTDKFAAAQTAAKVTADLVGPVDAPSNEANARLTDRAEKMFADCVKKGEQQGASPADLEGAQVIRQNIADVETAAANIGVLASPFLKHRGDGRPVVHGTPFVIPTSEGIEARSQIGSQDELAVFGSISLVCSCVHVMKKKEFGKGRLAKTKIRFHMIEESNSTHARFGYHHNKGKHWHMCRLLSECVPTTVMPVFEMDTEAITFHRIAGPAMAAY